jgi:carnitine-CoA ligase
MTPLIPADLALHDQTLPALLHRQAHLGDRVFIHAGEGRVTFGQATEFAARSAARLSAAGLKKGDRVATLAGNSLALIETWLGAAWLGAVFAPINTAARGQVLQHMLENADPTVLIVDPELAPRVSECGAKMPSLKALWPITELPAAEGVLEAATVSPADPLLILYTSGTTGPSKGVVCPHAQFFWWGVLNRQALGLVPGDIIYTVLPQFHTNALNTLWQALVTGATYAVGTRFSASRFWDELIATRATVTHLLGAMTNILLSRPSEPHDRSHTVRIALSSATKAESVARFEQRFGVALVDGYGSTETNFVFSNRNGDAPAGTMGRPFPQFDVALLDELDQPVLPGVAGELAVRPKVPFALQVGIFAIQMQRYQRGGIYGSTRAIA